MCDSLCPVLSQPVNAASCSKKLLSHDFSDPTTALRFYTFAPAVPAVVLPSHWSVAGGVLSTAASSGCTITATNPSLAFLSSPSWLNGAALGQWYQMNVSVQVTSGVVGVAFRIQDGSNYYYATIDRDVGAYRAGIVQSGVGFTSFYSSLKWASNGYKAGQYFDLSVQATAYGFLYYVSVCSD